MPLPRRGTDRRGLLFGVGCPVLAQQRDELFCAFVGEVHSGAVDRVDGNRCRDEVGESTRPFGFEEETSPRWGMASS